MPLEARRCYAALIVLMRNVVYVGGGGGGKLAENGDGSCERALTLLRL